MNDILYMCDCQVKLHQYLRMDKSARSIFFSVVKFERADFTYVMHN